MPFDGAPSLGQDVIARVAAAFGIPPEQITSKRRDVPTVNARWAAFLLMRDRLQWTHAKIGAVFGGVDQTTVQHGVNKASALMMADDDYRRRVMQAGGDLQPLPIPVIAMTTDAPGTLDYIVIDRLTQQMRQAWKSKLRNNPAAFRRRYAKTYKRVREALR